MKKLTAVACLSLLFCLYKSANAEVLELDSMNVSHCRQQIVEAKDDMPVIFLYDSEHWTNEFLPIYEAVSNALPNRTFFKFNIESPGRWYLQSNCLQMSGVPAAPTVFMVAKDKEVSVITIPLVSFIGIDKTKEDVIKLINDPMAVSMKSKVFSKYKMMK